jgi:hypothetical protein
MCDRQRLLYASPFSWLLLSRHPSWNCNQLQASSRMAAHDRRRRHSNPAVLDSLSSLASVVSGSGGRLSPYNSFTSVGPTTPASQSNSPRLFASDSFTLGDRKDRKEAFVEPVKLGRHGSLNKIMSPVNKIKESLKGEAKTHSWCTRLLVFTTSHVSLYKICALSFSLGYSAATRSPTPRCSTTEHGT